MQSDKLIVILVPRKEKSSPVLGAEIIYKSLESQSNVFLLPISRKNKKNFLFELRDIIRTYFFLIRKVKNFERLLVISFGIQADFVCFLLRRKIIAVSAIRGYLDKVYEYRFGKFGRVIHAFHIFLIKKIGKSFVMSEDMNRYYKNNYQISSWNIRSAIHENLPIFRIKRSQEIGLVYLGSLTKGKGIEEMLPELEKLFKKYKNYHMHFIGDGLLKSEIVKFIKFNNLENKITMHGFLENPFEVLSCCKIMIHPSFTEGISRALMEGMYLGLIPIARRIPAMDELIMNQKNGFLFDNINEITHLISCANELKVPKGSLLPKEYRFEHHRKLIKNTLLNIFENDEKEG